MRRTNVLLSVILALSSTPLLAAHFGDFYVVPVAGHAPGINGSLWESDLVIHNFQTTPLTVELALVDSGFGAADNVAAVVVDGSTTITVPPGGTRMLGDVLANHRQRASSIGALLVGSDRPFAVTSRIVNVDASGTGVGQTVAGAQDFLSSVSQRAFIPGLAANANFRTNIGLVAAATAGAPLLVEVTLLDASGAVLGANAFPIAAGTITHFQFGSTSLTTVPFDTATAVVRIVSGAGDVTAYASVIDNRSNQATFLASGFAGESGSSGTTFASFLGAPEGR